jgi:hypothetical protein
MRGGSHSLRHPGQQPPGADLVDPLVGRKLGRNPVNDAAADQKVGRCRLMDVSIMVVNSSAADQVARAWASSVMIVPVGGSSAQRE